MLDLLVAVAGAIVEAIVENPEIVVAVVGGVSVLALAGKFDFLKKRFRSVVKKWLRKTGASLKLVCLKVARSAGQYKQTLIGINEREKTQVIKEKTLTKEECEKEGILPLADGKKREIYNAEELLVLQG
ncbi:MAG: hypothetical protein K6C40_15760 [Thermoguttaceae bacterium]|nr:hypothetical protein [Thermoguttaceae bacterium]